MVEATDWWLLGIYCLMGVAEIGQILDSHLQQRRWRRAIRGLPDYGAFLKEQTWDAVVGMLKKIQCSMPREVSKIFHKAIRPMCDPILKRLNNSVWPVDKKNKDFLGPARLRQDTDAYYKPLLMQFRAMRKQDIKLGENALTPL